MTAGFQRPNPALAHGSQTPDEVLALSLAAARRGGFALAGWLPESAEQAFNVQRLVMESLGETVGAWKTAGSDENGVPLIAPIHAGDIVRDEVRRPPAEGWLIEVELGFRLKRDIPAKPRLGYAEVLEAVSDVLVCFELCRTRLSDPKPPRLLFMADGLANDGLVIGSGVAMTQSLALGDRQALLMIDGRPVQKGKTPDHLAVISKLVWLARQQSLHGGLKAGQVVITGSITPIAPLEAGQVAEATVDGIGTVKLYAEA